MIFDIIQTVVNYSSLRNQINCSKINKYFNDDIRIFHLDCPRCMDQQIIGKKYSKK